MSRWLFDLGNTRLKAPPVDARECVGEELAIAHDGSAYAAG